MNPIPACLDPSVVCRWRDGDEDCPCETEPDPTERPIVDVPTGDLL